MERKLPAGLYETGFEDVERAKDFGLPYIYHRHPEKSKNLRCFDFAGPVDQNLPFPHFIARYRSSVRIGYRPVIMGFFPACMM